MYYVCNILKGKMKKKKEFIEINQEKLYPSVENYNYYNLRLFSTAVSVY